MNNGIQTKPTLLLNEKDYKIFKDFSLLLSDLSKNADNEYLDELLKNFMTFICMVNVEKEK